ILGLKHTGSRSSLRAPRHGACCRHAWRAGSMVRHAPIHRRSGHSDIAICCGRNVRGSSPSTSVVPLSNQVTTLNHKRFKGFKMFSDGHLEYLWGSSSGEGQARRPLEFGSPPSLQGLSPNANPSRTSQIDPVPRPCSGPSSASFDVRDSAPATEYPRPGWRAYSPLNVAACADEPETVASPPCRFVGSSAETTT